MRTDLTLPTTKDFAHCRLDSIFSREFQRQTSGHFEIFGSTSFDLFAYFLTNSQSLDVNRFPHVVILTNAKELNKFAQAIHFFDPDMTVWSCCEYDISPFSGLYPSPNRIRDRLEFLFSAFQGKRNGIYLATWPGLHQPTLPYRVFAERSFELTPGMTLPQDFMQRLEILGYSNQSLVEDVGQYAVRGGMIDIFSPAQVEPIRIELFGDVIESMRTFSIKDQRSVAAKSSFYILPAKEVLFVPENEDYLLEELRKNLFAREIDPGEREEFIRGISQQTYSPGMEFLTNFFYKDPSCAMDYFSTPLSVWFIDREEIVRSCDSRNRELIDEHRSATHNLVYPNISPFLVNTELNNVPPESRLVSVSNLRRAALDETDTNNIEYISYGTEELSRALKVLPLGSPAWLETLKARLIQWKENSYKIFISCKNSSLAARFSVLLEKIDFTSEIVPVGSVTWDSWLEAQVHKTNLVHIIPRALPESQRLEDDRIVFLVAEDFFGKRDKGTTTKNSVADFQKEAKRLSFGDLQQDDFVVHIKHGIGQYDGLRVMSVGGADSEFIQISYRDKDKLYVPVYHIGQLQKYASSASQTALDKLGGQRWEKTKSKVREKLRDLAAELLALYAERKQVERPVFNVTSDSIFNFENDFPYEETDDQLRAIEDIKRDLSGAHPMDRLICGDVGFGKTEVAMRACFLALENKRQSAILAPTTVLTFQHFETFKKRFAKTPARIKVLNRFVSSAEVKKTLSELKLGNIDILIGTHRLLSKDVVFNNLGLLIVDEEQRFGVAHKERIKKLRTSVDTLSLSATPIPRTLNMSLFGVRDLSLISTPPVDRLPTRTFVCKYEGETVRKAVLSELARGGQVYFIHNRIQSIYSVADELRKILPNIRMGVAHGQMPEDELEKTMLAFFHHEIDLLLCTAIVESGMDVSRANTMFIDQAQTFGLSQLYQLRGRVGRSKDRAYCYLILPKDKKLDKLSQERLKVIQENTALGSGVKVAQYDLELRGAGNLLGEDQSGHAGEVGYELYSELLSEALATAQGKSPEDVELDPDLNLRIPALIPESYISDVRLRLTFYKSLADIKSEEDLEQIEQSLADQFGPLPDVTINLLGLMLIRRMCKNLRVRDISAGPQIVTLWFCDDTPLPLDFILKLATKENKKYAISPDNRLSIRMKAITWSHVYEELKTLEKGRRPS